MSYINYVNAAAGKLGPIGRLKLAEDLALLLDHPSLQLELSASGGYGHDSVVEPRQKAFDMLCALLEFVGSSLPPLEENLWRGYVLKDADGTQWEEAKAKSLRVAEMIGQNRSGEADIARNLGLMFTLFSGVNEYNPGSRITYENLVARLNLLLVDTLHLHPFRPDYSKISLPETKVAPATPKRIVIVDDDPKELFKTALALAGVQNVVIEPYLQKCSAAGFNPLEGDPLRDELERVGSEILALSPDIVLMDQGMNRIFGHHLAFAMQSSYNCDHIKFVANTSGGMDKMESIGVHLNFAKGEKLVHILW